MTKHLSAVHVLQLMVEAGGSIGIHLINLRVRLSILTVSFSCFESNLNGEYFTDPDDNGYYRGIIWELWLGDYSLKAVKMMIRPKDFSVGYDPDSRDTLAVPPDP